MNRRITLCAVILLATQLFWSATAAADTEAPTVIISWPTHGTSISGNTRISAASMDNIGVSRVAFFVDGALVRNDMIAPFSINWDTSSYADGNAEVQVIAFDAAGNYNDYTINVTVNNNGPDTVAPNVLITWPGEGATVSGITNIHTAAVDDTGVSVVTFAVDGTTVGNDTTAPYSFNWDSSAHSDGAATIQVTSYDLAGNSSSYSIDVTVENQDNHLPQPVGFQCYGCDDTNIKEKDTINSYNNDKGLYKASSLWRIPWLEMDYIPQGIHVAEDGHVYMSMYHKDKKGVSDKSSIIIKYSTITNRITDVYHLKNSNNSKYKGHVGGLVVHGDYFIVPHGSDLYYFKQSDAVPIYGIESEIKLGSITSVGFGGSNYNVRMSFVSTTKDHQNQDILWAGQFSTSTSAGSHILGYKIEANGMVNPVPIYRFYVPETVNKLQGVTILNASYGNYTLLLSRSYGDNSSYISKLDYIRQESSPYKYEYNSKSIAFKGPAGLEDIHVSNDGVWSLSESGANYYQYRNSNPWDQLFPFIIKLRKSDM